MKRKIVLPIISLIFGFLLAGTAIFANTLGLDQNEGWSRARIWLLLFGTFIVLCSLLYYRYVDEVHSIAGKIQVIAESLPTQYFILPIVVVVILVYVWFGSSGRWNIWKSHTYYYDNLAKGFQNNKLDIPLKPDPKLLDLPNPYDPVARKGIDAPVDITLYKGKFYMYWGPVPALLLTIIYSFYHRGIGDLFLTFGFVCGIFFVQTLLIFIIWNRYFRNLPRWTLYLSIFLIGFASPLMLLRHNYESAMIYEAAITGGQLFFMSGFLAALIAVTRFSISKWWLAWYLSAAGFLWALAIGTRLILAPQIALVVLVLTFWLFKVNAWSFKKTIQLLIPLGLPLVLGFVCLGWYNWARFGSATESGLYYQLAGWNIRAHYKDLFSQKYVLQNIYNYLFTPIGFTSKFPFVSMGKGSENPIFSFYSVPAIYNAQPIAGLFYTFPFVIFSVVPFFALFFKRKTSQSPVEVRDQIHLNLITLSLSISSLIAFGLLMLFFWVGMRYWGDVTPPLMALSVVGFWQGYQFLANKLLAGRLYSICGVALASASILLSTLLAISTNDGLIKLLFRKFPFP